MVRKASFSCMWCGGMLHHVALTLLLVFATGWMWLMDEADVIEPLFRVEGREGERKGQERERE